MKELTKEEIAKQVYPDVEGYLDQVEHDRIQFIRGLEYSDQNTKPLIDEIAELIFYPQYPEEGDTDSERIYVRQLVQKYIQKGSKENLFTDDDFRALDNYDI